MTPPAKSTTDPFSPSEVKGSVDIPPNATAWKKWSLIFGPGLLISIGYIDPGNWATDIAAGSQYGYDLIFIILLSNLAAIFLQTLSMRVGITTGHDLAQLSRKNFKKPVNFVFWLFAEIAIIACDIAEVLGTALAFHLLFGVSLTTGILITLLDTLIVLGLRGRGFRQIEAIIFGMLLTVGICFAYQLTIAGADWSAVMTNMVPSFEALNEPGRVYLAIGIIGATVMPHNLYLHSAIVQTRHSAPTMKAKKELIFYNTIDTTLALFCAFLINAAILILAASTFFGHTEMQVTGIEDAHKWLAPALGSTLAAYAFAIALLAAGQSSTFTGTIAGQIILEGYLNLKIPFWIRRFITRGLALIPALIGVLILGDSGIDKLMVLSQVILGLQLPLIMYPLLRFSADKKLMGDFKSGLIVQLIGWMLFGVITIANIWVLINL